MLSNLFIKDIRIKWEDISERSYLKGIPAIASIDDLQFEKPITFFVGENGSGKSTLLEAIAVAYGFNPEGGTKNYSFSTYDSHSELCDYVRLSRGYVKPRRGYFLRAESFYNVATKEDEYSKSSGGDDRYIPQEFHLKSRGESFLQLAQNYFGPNGIFFLDEPEAALSPQRQLTLLYEMNKCATCGSQFIVVTHSPILLGVPDADIISFDDGAIHRISYEETESYKVMEMFINRREQVLENLFS